MVAASYGDRAHIVTKIAEERKLGRRLVRGHPMLEAEVVYAVQHEYCETPEDFIARRTRLAFLDVDACRVALPRVGLFIESHYLMHSALTAGKAFQVPHLSKIGIRFGDADRRAAGQGEGLVAVAGTVRAETGSEVPGNLPAGAAHKGRDQGRRDPQLRLTQGVGQWCRFSKHLNWPLRGSGSCGDLRRTVELLESST